MAAEEAENQDSIPRSAMELITRLQAMDVRLAAHGDRLACDAPKGVLNEETRAALKRHKQELLQILAGLEERGGADFLELGKNLRERGSQSLSPAQQRLWYLEQIDSLGTANNISVVLRLTGKLNRGALERALREIAGRHEVLRSAIISDNGIPTVRVTSADDWKLEYHDLRDDNSRTRDEVIEHELGCPIDFQSGLMMRATLLETGELESVLLVCLHHIATDGWSMGIIASELEQLYTAFCAGLPTPLPPLQAQYSDFGKWQNQWLKSPQATVECRYWEEKLKGVETLELPADRPRLAVPSHLGTRVRHYLSDSVVTALRSTAREEGLTLYMVLLAGFYMLLHRYTRQTDLTVGGAVAGRHKPEFESLVGLFVNSLALRTSLAGDPTVRELFARVKETTLDALAHQNMPFDRVVAAVQPQREVNRAPLFEVMLILHNLPGRLPELPDLHVERLLIDQGSARFDLTIEVLDENGKLSFEMEYRTGLFDEATIRRLAANYERLLGELCVDAGRRISDLSVLSEADVAELLSLANGKVLPYRHDGPVCEWIDAQSSATPEAVAVIYEDRQVTYVELARRSNRLARRLRELGVSRGSLVGVCLERSEEIVVAVLAVWKAGGAYVPLDPQYPAERLAFMAEDAAIGVLVTEEHLRDLVPMSSRTRVLSVDTEQQSIARQSSDNFSSGLSAEDPAYVIFTSGSTGKPKGVQITHRALANFLTSMLNEPGLTSRDVLLSVTTLSFDIAGLELYLPLVCGARIVMAPRDVAADGRRLAELITRSGATVMQATPATWRLLLDSGWGGHPGLKIVCGGEALPQDLARRLLSLGCDLWNAYGPTETTIWSTLQHVTSPEQARSIGRPIANTTVVILDETGRLAPRGTAGELCIGGDGIALGYLNRPELTAERFVPCPSIGGKRVYRSGDLARWLPDGTLEFLGRIDHQIKIRGLRVELGEIEAALESLPAVKQAVVALRDFGDDDRRLVAYLSTRDSERIQSSAIRKQLSQTLPDYMVPAHIVELPSMPLTPNGKVDRRALPAPRVSNGAPVAPRSAVEQRVAGLWQEVLRAPEVGIHDNFFDIGGHSLLLVQLQNRLRGIGCELSIQELFRRPTVAAIAEHLNSATAGELN